LTLSSHPGKSLVWDKDRFHPQHRGHDVDYFKIERDDDETKAMKVLIERVADGHIFIRFALL
jgi:hypothetical protein